MGRRCLRQVAATLSVAGLVWTVAVADERGAKSGSSTPNQAGEAEAREQVQQALLAETRGDNEERAALLKKALDGKPDLPEANWQAARIQVEGEWLPLSEAVARAANDPKIQEYRELREKAAGNVKLLRELARWCIKNEWPDVARLHYAQLLKEADATAEMKEDAIKKLDLRNVGGQWFTAKEIEAHEEARRAVQAAMAKWRPRLKKLQTNIDGDDLVRREPAIAEFHKLDDPAIISVLESFLNEGQGRLEEEIIKRLAAFKQYEATEALVRFAVIANSVVTRDKACAALGQRPIHEYVPLLLRGLTAPIKGRYQIAWDKKGNISYTQAFLREGSSADLLLVSQALAAPKVTNTLMMTNVRDRPGEERRRFVSGTTPQEAFQQELASVKSLAAKAQTEALVANSAISAANQRVFEALERSTGQQLPREPQAWWTWWQSYNQKYWPRTSHFAYQSNAYNYYANTVTLENFHSCFLAGTPVHAEAGEVPIETIKPGDRVLSQNQDTGELAYRVVLTKTLRPPTEMVSIQAEDEMIVATQGHPFWVVGQGWRMAKELKEGDLLHRLRGAARISAVTTAADAAAHNLVVDEFNTYFVGKAGLLVHDNEFRKPTWAIVPGLLAD